MPTSRRTASTSLMSSLSSTPSTTIVPDSCASSRLMQRIIVDLPDPEGPHTTTRSPSPTLSVTSRSAWKSPKNFETPLSSMMGAPFTHRSPTA